MPLIDENEEYAEVYVDGEGQHRWRIKAVENDDVLGDSGQGYSNQTEMFRALGRVSHRQPTLVQSKDAQTSGADMLRVVRVDG